MLLRNRSVDQFIASVRVPLSSSYQSHGIVLHQNPNRTAMRVGKAVVPTFGSAPSHWHLSSRTKGFPQA